MFRKSFFPPITRLYTCLSLLLLSASFGLTACFPSGCSECYSPDTTPLVDANGILYYTAHTTLYALQDRSGKLLWQYTNPSLSQDGPVVNNGMVYLVMDAVDNSNSEQMSVWAYALSASTGRVLWNTQISSASQRFDTPKPEVIDGMVYIEESGANYGSTFFALRASDGKILWSQSPNGGSGESVTLLLASAGIAYLNYYTSTTGYVLAKRDHDGALLWQYAFPSCSIFSVPPVDETLYITAFCKSKEETDAFQADTGKLLWRFSLPGNGLMTVTPTHNVVYVHGSPKGEAWNDSFFALDANTGQLLWQRDTPPTRVVAGTNIWAADDNAVYTMIDGVWDILGARDGKELWKFSFSAPLSLLSPRIIPLNMQSWMLSNNLIYIPEYDQIDVFTARTGKLNWKFSLPSGDSMSAIMLAQGIIYLTENDPNQQKQDTYAIQADTGQVLWHTIQTHPPQLITQNGVYFNMVTGKPYHYTDNILALQSDSGKQIWTFQS